MVGDQQDLAEKGEKLAIALLRVSEMLLSQANRHQARVLNAEGENFPELPAMLRLDPPLKSDSSV
ncbi:MAG: hypothetical protein ABIR70_21030 [Bryobacteraceae bacterium]